MKIRSRTMFMAQEGNRRDHWLEKSNLTRFRNHTTICFNLITVRKTTAPLAKAAIDFRSTAPPAPVLSVPSVASRSQLSRLAPLEAILFDLDGTLCGSDAINIYAFRKMLLKMGYNKGVAISEKFFAENISGKNTEAITRFLFPDWDVEKAMKWMEEKVVVFRR